MLRQRFLGWLLSSILVLATVHGQVNLASGPTLAYTAPFRIEAVDHPADTFTGTHVSLVYKPDLGRTYVSYYDVTQHTLKLAYNTWPNVQGNCNVNPPLWACLTLDGDGLAGHSVDDVGMFSSVDINPSGFPVVRISYYDKTIQAIKYAEYDCAFICNLTTEIVDDPASGVEAGSYGTAIKVTQAGIPYIAYSYTNNANHNLDEIRLAHRVGSGGNCGSGAAANKWQCDTIDRGNLVGQSPSLALYESGGNLTIHLAFLRAGNVLVYGFTNSSGENCAGGAAAYWSCYQISQPAGGVVSLYSIYNIPYIAYYDPTGGNLRFAAYTGPVAAANCGTFTGGKNYWRCDTIEQISKTLPHPSHASLDLVFDHSGRPAIAYSKFFDLGSSLYIARPIGAYNVDPGNCGPVPDGGFEQTWWCSAVARAGVYTSEAAFTAIGIQSNGLAVIAYTEDDTYDFPGSQRLMVATQSLTTYLPVIRR